MLPLETKATIAGLSRPMLLKLAGLAEIAEAKLPFERMALDLRALPPDAGRMGSGSFSNR
ncbi:hypothetical protein ACYX7E_04390 [Luteimonas sp. RIT-PG2_3]